jgi:hypothetical protein
MIHTHHPESSVPVIGSTAQNGQSPVNLLGNHRPNEAMRPCLSAKSQLFISVILNALRNAIGAANPKRNAWNAVIAPPRELFRKLA